MRPPHPLRGTAETSGGRTATADERSSRHVSRRALCGGVGSAVGIALAGCTGGDESPYGTGGLGAAELPPATLGMETVTDSALPARVLYSIGVDDGPDRRADLMDDILDGGATVERTSPPLPANQHVYYDDAVYVLSFERRDRTPATEYWVTVDIVQGSVDESAAVQFADLPAVDREKFAARGWDDGGEFGYGTAFHYTHAEREDSVLVPDSEYAYIVWADGSEAAWSVGDSAEMPLYTYAYTAEQYATAAEYGRRMREEVAFELEALSEGEAEIVRTAINDQYTVDHGETPPEAFWSLTDRFRQQDHVRGPHGDGPSGLSGPYLVRYEGEGYWTKLEVSDELIEKRTDE